MLRSVLIAGALLPLVALAQSEKPPNTGYNGGEDNPQNPDDAGAAGASKGAFTLSPGALAAIIVVAVIVVVGGTGSAVLFWLAKKRQWDVRQSIRRASRRITGRAAEPSKRENRRTGVRLNSPPPGRNARRENRDIEKGLAPSSQRGKTTTTITSTFDVDTSNTKGGR